MTPLRDARLTAALADRYRLDRELGSGGMATVYLAHDLKHDRPVAIKVLHPELGASLGSDRFLQEIRVAAKLQHPHIVGLLDSGVVPATPDASAVFYYVMPYIAGETLRDHLARQGALSTAETVRLTVEVADALARAHKAGIVHRDIKPENILIADDHAFVMDFGVAKALAASQRPESLHGTRDPSPLTSAGLSLGTPAYMAPEQVAADPRIDHRADLYALGLVMYEMMTCSSPYPVSTPQQQMAAHVTQPPAPIQQKRPDCPPALAELIMKCLAKDPADRWQTADDIQNRLQTIDLPRATVTTPGGSRRPILGLALVAALAAAGFLLWRATRGDAPGSAAHSLIIARRVGVLPFVSRSQDSSDAYLGDGMATDLTTTLAGMAGLHVVSRSSAFALRGKTAHEAGTMLTADAMVEGTVGKVEDRLRVTVSLVNVADEAVLWSQRYDVTERDFYALQDSAAQAIASVLGVGLDRRADPGLAAHRTANPEAHDLVLRGQFLAEQNSEAGLHQAITLFERAAALDSTYADAWNGIAQAWFFLADSYMAPRAAVPPMRAAIERALALDPTSAWAHALMGSLLSTYVRDYPAAEREYRTATALDSTSVFVGDYGWLLHGRGQDDSALAVVRRARRHNPFAFAPANLAWTIFSNMGMVDSANAACQAVLRLAADLCGERMLIQEGRAAAVVSARKGNPPTSPAEITVLAEALARSGDVATARRQLAAALAETKTRYVREDYVAAVYLALGDTTRTLEWLERGLDAQAANLAQLNRTWRFRPLHGHPGFDAIVRRAGLEPRP